MRFTIIAPLFGLLLTGSSLPADPDFSQVPGVVVAHTPASSGIYYGSAGIAIMRPGVYLAKCDEFGPGSVEHQRAVTHVFRSEDRGEHWRHVARIDGLFWASVFQHRGAAYLLGTEKHHGRIVVMRSDDEGATWTAPSDEHHGLLTPEGEYHTAPMPVITHQGRLWRAVEDAMGGTLWGERYRARMLSIPADVDLLERQNWTLSNPLARDPAWLGGAFGGWLEGNAVATPEGQIVNILRVACPEGGKAAVVRVSRDGQRVSFDATRDFIDFPGGAKKFVIRYDGQSKAYWALANPVMPRHRGEAAAASIRNTLALLRSEDLKTWRICCLLDYHPDVKKHGFQYPDWLFEGDDIIAAIRTAYDDGLGGAHSAHDANFLTFQRFPNFRRLTMADSVVDSRELAPKPQTSVDTAAMTVEGSGFNLAAFDEGAIAFGNRRYVWRDVPPRFRGWRYTQTNGGEGAQIAVIAKADSTLLAAATAAQAAGALRGWSDTGESFVYTDASPTLMKVFQREVGAGQTVSLIQGGWTGTLLLIPPEAAPLGATGATPPRPLNVLFLAADDLRVELGCYGDTLVKSPNLDRLAVRGMLFNRAYSQQALCNPSRASLMTGLRPDTLGIWDLPTHFRHVRPDLVTLPELFKQHGYYTRNIGKIYHNWRQDIQGDPQSWSVPAMMHFAPHNSDVPQVEGGALPPNLSSTLKTECRDVPDEAYFDGRIAAEAVRALRELSNQPFFLAVGFWKPHLPFNAPKKYWDLYDPADVSLPANPEPPSGVPAIALHNGRELLGDEGRTLTDEEVRELRRGYYAGTSYLDAQIGKVLDELDRLQLTDRTVVVFWSDHGFHLGEHDLWCKTSNFELDARVPLIVAAPRPQHPGGKSDSLVELLDIYPTLVQLCGLPAPADLEGASLVPVLADPETVVKPAAFTQHPRPAYYTGEPQVMGCSARGAQFRYTEWRDYQTGRVVARELYDHQADPRETRNLADAVARRDDVTRMAALLAKGFRPVPKPPSADAP